MENKSKAQSDTNQPESTSEIGPSTPQARRSIARRLIGLSPEAFVLASMIASGLVTHDVLKGQINIPETENTPATENLPSFREQFVRFSYEYFKGTNIQGYNIVEKFSNTPQVFEVKDFTPLWDHQEQTAYEILHNVPEVKTPRFNGDIYLQRDTRLDRYTYQGENGLKLKITLPDVEPSIPIKPGDIKANYVTPVFGDEINTDSITAWTDYTNATFKGVDVLTQDNGEVHGDIWWALTDASGNYVDPQGNKLESGTKPYYVPGFFLELNDKYFGDGVTHISTGPVQSPEPTPAPPGELP